MKKIEHYEANEEFNCKKILGIDVEKEDREVGIFGNTFMLGIETEEKKNFCLIFGDDEFLDLVNALKPYVLSQMQEEEMEKEMFVEHEHDNYEAYLESIEADRQENFCN